MRHQQRGIAGIGMTSARTRDRLVERLRAHGIRSEAVLNQIRNVPRHLFVDEALASRAYEDTALPIGYNQTISQPYIVAVMTDLVLRNNPRKVLEIGTGSGYQAAVLAPLVEKVYTVERIEPLAVQARQRFEHAVTLRPHQANAYYGLALALEALQDYQGALGAMRTYVHLAPKDSPHLRRAWSAIWEWQSLPDTASTEPAVTPPQPNAAERSRG